MNLARRGLIVIGLGLALVGPAAAQSPSEPDGEAPVPASAPSAVVAAIAHRWAVEPGRVHLEWGPGPVLPEGAVSLLGSGIRGAFVVEVDGPSGAVRRRLRAGVRRTVAVAARDLPRATTLGPDDLAFRDTVVWGSAEPTPVEVGWKTARRLQAGSLLGRPAVAPPAAVVAGRVITLVWRGRGLEVTTRGVAVGTAAAGDRVAVRTESGRRLWGVAVSSDRVEIEGSRQ